MTKQCFACTLIFAATFLTPLAHGHGTDADQPPAILVSASGSVDVAPDMAVVTMTVRREGKTARVALNENNAAMASVLKAMKDLGIANRDLQTSRFSINPRMSRPVRNSQQQKTPQIIGYIVQNSITARVRDLTKIGVVLDTGVTLGVNQGGQIQFSNANPDAAISQARAKAMKAAIAKAKTLVSAAGVKLGKIQKISETSRSPRPVAMAQGRMMAMADAGGEVPVQGGENSYTVSVNVTWRLSQ